MFTSFMSKLFSVFTAIIILSTGINSFAANPIPSVPIAVTENPETGEQSQLVLNPTSQEQLEEMSPRNLNSSQKLKTLIEKFKSSAKDTAVDSGKSFLNVQGDFALFAAATGAVAVQKLLTEYDNNPNALKEFWTRQIENPFAWLSFYAFYVANRGSGALYEALVTKFGWMRNEKLFASFMDQLAEAHFNKGMSELVATGEIESAKSIYQKANALIPKPLSHNFFSEMKAPFALGMGVFFLNLSFELISDPNIERCVSDLNKEKQIDFCDLAYHDWVVKGKILDQAPMLAGTVLTAWVQAFVINHGGPKGMNLIRASIPLKLSEKMKSYEFKGFELALSKAKKIARLRPVAFVASGFLFLEALPIITKPIDDAYQRNKLGSEVARHESRLNELSVQKLSQAELLEEVNDYAKAQMDWRGHWLRPVTSKILSWLDYVSNLQGNYFSSKLFYRELIKRFDLPNRDTQHLFESTPYYGLDPNYSIQAIAQKVANAIQFANKKVETLKALGARADESQIESILLLRSVVSSLISISPSAHPNESLAAELLEIQKNKSANEYEKSLLIERARQTEFVKGIHKLQKLAVTPIVAKNGFVEMNEILKGAQPLDKGEFEMNRINYDPNFITQRNESQFPMKVDDITITSESEYLLSQFVCNQETLLKESWGVGLSYHPPQMIDTGARNFCKLTKNNLTSESLSATAYNAIYELPDHTQVQGLLGLAQKLLRKDFQGDAGLDHFEVFWANKVDAPLQVKLALKDQEYSEMLAKNLVPLAKETSETHFGSIQVPDGLERSFVHEYDYYIHLIESLSQTQGAKLDLRIWKQNAILQEQLLSHNLKPEELRKKLSVPEIGDLNTKLTAASTADKKLDAKKLERTNIIALSEVLAAREDASFGTLIESMQTKPELVSAFIFIKMKMAAMKLQWKNLLILEESIEIRGLQ